MVSPVTVTVTAVFAAIASVAVVTMIRVLVGVATVPVGVTPPLNVTSGVPVLAKKPDGYVSVMVLPAASAPPALVVNENVAAAPVFPATRSEAAIENEAFCTCPPIFPELTLEEAHKSFEVFTLTVTECAVAAPMVIPLNVTMNGTDALIMAPDVKKTTDVALVTEHSMIKPCTLVSPTLTTGCTKGAKKLRG
jgi:hypothetical protein